MADGPGKRNQSLETDELYKSLLERCNGENIEQVANFCDEVFDFIRRNTRYLSNKRCQALIKQKLSANIATAARDAEPKRRSDPTLDAAKRDAARKRAEEQARKQAEEEDKKQVDEVEELDPSMFQSKVENENIEVEDDDDDESGEVPNAGNGGSTDVYSWTQTLDEVDVRIEVPSHIKGKHLIVTVKKDRLLVGLKGKEPLIDGELDEAVIESMWTLESEQGKKFVSINMEKLKGMCWWKRLIKGDVGIKTKKVQPENSKLGDLDGETRKTVEKMMFDQRQKEMGKPTSKEMEQRSKLQQFMDAHPEMDFSNAKFSGSGKGGFGGMGGFS